MMLVYFRTPKFMTYKETLDFLYKSLPMFQRVGATAFKKDLTNTLLLCKELDNPQHKFKSIHVAGTNGKGSTSHMLAAILQTAGYKTGLYTSPHLKEFTERIKINGIDVSQDFVVGFVERIKSPIERIKPSFFEVTVVMAFDYFAQQNVDIAVIEVGMGGRLDSTNVITPLLSVITNISYDHMDLLGNTLPAIAYEKAGIIKPAVPVVIGERQPETDAVFVKQASLTGSEIIFAEDRYKVKSVTNGKFEVDDGRGSQTYTLDLKGNYQKKNLAGVLATLELLKRIGFEIKKEDIHEGLLDVIKLTGLKGRWQTIKQNPLVICDTGHNEAGIKEILKQIGYYKFHKLHFVLGMVKDKDVGKVLKLLPKDAYYYFCEAKIPRAMNAEELKDKASSFDLYGEVIPDVNDAIKKAVEHASKDDFIFVGGSTFVVAEIENL
jgi:dihydrofolate synthase/folylpolyglutamate synthase